MTKVMVLYLTSEQFHVKISHLVTGLSTGCPVTVCVQQLAVPSGHKLRTSGQSGYSRDIAIAISYPRL
jgi:hypothetical protein